MHRVVVFSNGETWEMAEGCRLCEITDEQFKEMEEGAYPYQMDPVPTGILLDEHYGKEAETLRKGIEDLIKEHTPFCTPAQPLEDLLDDLNKLLETTDAVDSLHYLADQKNKETIQMADPLKQLQADIARLLKVDYIAVYDMRADIQLVLDEVDARHVGVNQALVDAAKEAQMLNNPIDVAIKKDRQACKDKRSELTGDEEESAVSGNELPLEVKIAMTAWENYRVGTKEEDKASFLAGFLQGRRSVIGETWNGEEKIT